MNELIQIYTDIFKGNFSYSRKIIFLAEGYTANDENLFYKDIYEILDRMGNTLPFSILKGNGNDEMFSVFVSFSPSSQHGYSNSASGAVGSTVFESYVENGEFNINKSKINQYIDNMVYHLPESSTILNLNHVLSKGVNNSIEGFTFYNDSTLVFILLPESNTPNIELEILDSSTYHAIITSADFFSEQIIIRAIGKMLKLGDEFDLPGSEYLEPSDLQKDLIISTFGNLHYAPNIFVGPNPTTDNFPWKSFFEKNNNIPIPLHNNTTPNVPNRTLPAKSVSYTNIQLWEGGSGFRKNVYRSAEDCLMRRRIGDISLPVKTKRVAFCPVCRELLTALFTMN